MGHRWIVDVLSDLRDFAGRNGLDELAERLADTAEYAAVELALTELGVGSPAMRDSGGHHAGSGRPCLPERADG